MALGPEGCGSVFQVDATLDMQYPQSWCGTMGYLLGQRPGCEVGFQKAAF